MKDIPIIFSAPMVRALLDGRKTMTRRLAVRKNGTWSPWTTVLPGDRLWVRESLTQSGGYIAHAATNSVIQQEGGDPPSRLWRWKQSGLPSIHMPRWASRLTLIATAVKVERLQEITEADAQAEGMAREFRQVIANPRGFKDYAIPVSYRGGFVNVWNRLHEVPHQWEDNPEVVALTFTVHKTNIDALPKVEAA